MRVADNMTYEQVRSNIMKNRSEMSQLQNQAATQKRVTKPSDDPLASGRVLGGRIENLGQDQFLKNINYARSFLDAADHSLGEITEILVRAKELALSQANDASSNPESRRAVATEINQLHDQVVSVGNRKLGERYLFGGFQTTRTPFTRQGAYRGDDGEIAIQINKDSFVCMNVPGNRIFLGDGISDDGIARSNSDPAQSIEDWQKVNSSKEGPSTNASDELRGPASENKDSLSENQGSEYGSVEDGSRPRGHNLFSVLRGLEAALMTDDKAGVQDSLDQLDAAMEQVVLTRSSVGSRVMSLDATRDSLSKAKVDTKEQISLLEDADVFQVISDINKTESTLRAAMETSSKMIQPSLLDFLK